jgi:transcriptional regulator CtsR
MLEEQDVNKISGGMLNFTIKVDDQFVKLKLNELAEDTPALRGRILRRIGKAIKTDIVKNELQGQVLNKRTGELAKSIKYRVMRKGVGMSIGAFWPAFWGAVHEHGYTQHVRQGRAVMGKRGGRGMTRLQSVISKRPFVNPIIQSVFGSGEAQRLGEEQTEKWIKEHGL